MPAVRLDLLTEAVKVTRGTGIIVLPVMDLTTWGPGTPVAARDLNILGRDSSKFDERMREQIENETGRPQHPWPVKYTVSPFNQSVQDSLVDLVHRVAAVPGIAGLVWQSVNPPGYEGMGFFPGQLVLLNDGFTLPARLAFLRKEHVDPVDIDFEGVFFHLNDSLPEFDNSVQNQAIRSDWGQFLANEDQNMLRRLLGVARESARFPIPVLLEGGSGYFSWNHPADPVLTEAHSEGPDGTPLSMGSTPAGAMIAWVGVSAREPLQEVTRQLLMRAKQLSWNGVVFNLAPDSPPVLSPEQLITRLLPSPQAETPAPPEHK